MKIPDRQGVLPLTRAILRIETQAAERRAERDAWQREHGERAEREKREARVACHFGHGFGRDGRPKLHGGYRDFDVE